MCPAESRKLLNCHFGNANKIINDFYNVYKDFLWVFYQLKTLLFLDNSPS